MLDFGSCYGTYSTYGDMAKGLYAKAFASVSDEPSVLGQLNEKVFSVVDSLLERSLNCAFGSPVLSENYLVNLAKGLSRIDPKCLALDFAVITSSVFGSGLLALGAVDDIKNGEKRKAALKSACATVIAGAGIYGVVSRVSRAHCVAITVLTFERRRLAQKYLCGVLASCGLFQAVKAYSDPTISRLVPASLGPLSLVLFNMVLKV